MLASRNIRTSSTCFFECFETTFQEGSMTRREEGRESDREIERGRE
jgi:hypothetical protein